MAKIILIEDAKEGMITTEPIVNNQGQTLLPSGITLGANHLRILKTWNIKTIHIKSDESDEISEINDELLKIAEENLSLRMRWTDRNEIEKDLIKTAIYYNAILISKHGNKKDDKS